MIPVRYCNGSNRHESDGQDYERGLSRVSVRLLTRPWGTAGRFISNGWLSL